MTPTPTGTLIPPDDLANEQAIAALINQQRNAIGLPSLSLVSELTQAARRHSRDMADRNFTSHTGSDGSTGGQRMQDLIDASATASLFSDTDMSPEAWAHG